MNKCKWIVAWVGSCDATCEGELCNKHAGQRCSSCGREATHECDHTGIQFVCGAPLCDDCTHGLTMPGMPAGIFNLGGGHVTKQESERKFAVYLQLSAIESMKCELNGAINSCERIAEREDENKRPHIASAIKCQVANLRHAVAQSVKECLEAVKPS